MDLEERSEDVKIEEIELSEEAQRKMKELSYHEIEDTKEISENYRKLRRNAMIKSREEFCGNYPR